MKKFLLSLVLMVAVLFSGIANACIGDFCEPIETPDVIIQMNQGVEINGMTFEVDTTEIGCNENGMFEITDFNAIGSTAGVSAAIGAEITDKGNSSSCYGCDFTEVGGFSLIAFDGAVDIDGYRFEGNCYGGAEAGYNGNLNFEGISVIDFSSQSF